LGFQLTFFGEQFARRIEDLRPDLVALSFSAFLDSLLAAPRLTSNS
jgi:hypothetical protein